MSVRRAASTAIAAPSPASTRRRVVLLTVLLVSLLSVLAGQTRLAGEARAAATATVTGRVVDTAGQPLPGITVAVSPAGSGGRYLEATTSSTGTYSIAGATPGTSVLSTYDTARRHQVQYWTGTAGTSAYTQFTLAAGTTTADFTLPDQHQITGVATDAAGQPIPDVGYDIEYLLPNGHWQDPAEGPLLTDEQGSFTWDAATGRTYRFCFFDDYYGSDRLQPDRAERYTNKCWQSGTSIAAATDIPITATTPLQQTFTVSLTAAGKPLDPTEPFAYGNALVGSTLRVDTGRWQPAGVSFTYAWTYYDEDAGVVRTIPGATGPAYTPTAADAGRSLSAVVTGSAPGYKPAPQQTYAGTVGDPVPTFSAPLTITGSGVAGQPLTASHGTQTPAAAGRTLTWLVDGRVALTAYDDTTTFVPTTADIGKVVTLRYVSYASGYAQVQEYLVGPTVTGTLTAPTPTVSGTLKVGSRLTANAGTWGPAPVALAYQWYRSGAAIAGATAATYTLSGSDAAKAMSVRVTGTRSGYTTTTRTSAATAAVAAGTLTGPAPTISGTARVASTLTATPGTWGPAPVTLSYRWYRSGVAIGAATARTYKLVTADRGKTVTVKVSGTKTGYTTLARVSAKTAVVK